MDALQKSLESTLKELPKYFFARVIRKKLLAQGVKISIRKSEQFAHHILAGKTNFRVSNVQDRELTLEFDQHDAATISAELQNFLDKDLEKVLSKMIADTAPTVLKSLKRRWPVERGLQVRELTMLRKRLRKHWWNGLNRLRLIVTMSRDFGREINQEVRAAHSALDTAFVDVLTRLHARGCQVAEEIISLMEQGFADGAMARWRTLHEIAVTANFISDQDIDCARRYMDHEAIESHRAALEYEEVREALGYEAIPPEELASICSLRDSFLAKYGVHFGGPYGWASEALGMKKPTFKDIQKAAGDDTMRGHYRMASHGVHANPKGIYFSMAFALPTSILLAGPSNGGLADPGTATARSVVTLAASLLSLSKAMDYQVALETMLLLEKEIRPAFLRAHQDLEVKERKVREAGAVV